MKAITIISLIMLVTGIGFAIVGELGVIASVFLIPTSFVFLVIGKITFLLSAKFTSNRKKGLTYTTSKKTRNKIEPIKAITQKKDLTSAATNKSPNKMKSIKTVCFRMLIISIVFFVIGAWDVIGTGDIIEHRFEGFAIAAVMISYLLFHLFLLLLLVLIVKKITSVISAKIESRKTVESHKQDDLMAKPTAELANNQTAELTTQATSELTTKPTAEFTTELATNKPNAKMQTVKVISFTLFIISLILGALFYWGSYTQARYEIFNDFAGIIPVIAFFLSVLFFIIALLLIPMAGIFFSILANLRTKK